MEIASAGYIQCLDTGEKHRERERERERGLRNKRMSLMRTHSRRKGTKVQLNLYMQIVPGLSIIFNCSKRVFHYL